MSKETAKRDIIRIEASVRYAEDAEVNGIAEDEENPRMPFLERVTKDGNIIDVEVEDIGGDGNEADGGDDVLPDEPDPTNDAEEAGTTQTDDGDGEPSDGDEGMPW